MDIPIIIGTAAACASTASFAPQAWKIVKSRNTAGLSIGMYVLTVGAFGLWFAYGAIQGEWPLLVSNGICFGLSGFILVMSLLSRRQRNHEADVIEPQRQLKPTTRRSVSDPTGGSDSNAG